MDSGLAEPEQVIKAEGHHANLGREMDVTNGMMVRWSGKINEISPDRYKIQSNGILHIEHVSLSDAGEYICHWNTDNGIQMETIYHLIVKKRTQIINWIPEYTARVNQTIKLICTVITDPSLKSVTIAGWYKQGSSPSQAEMDQRYLQDTNEHSLTITNVQWVDQDNFRCLAKTPYDEKWETAKLIVKSPAGIPEITNVDCSPKKACISYQLNVKLSSSFEYRVQYRTSMESNWLNSTTPKSQSVHCHSMRPFRTYEFRVVLFYSDKLVKSNVNPDAVCKSDPDVPSMNPQNVQGKGTSQTNLVITWNPVPETFHYGPGFHYIIHWKRVDRDEKYNTVIVQDYKQSTFILEDQPTFTHYRIKVQSKNNIGVSRNELNEFDAYSGEGKPTQAPSNFQLKRHVNSTTVHLVWFAVPFQYIKGFPQGYKITIWPHGGIENIKQIPFPYESNERNFNEQHWLRAFTQGIFIPNLKTHTNYSAYIVVHNRLHDGPPSDVLNFTTSNTNLNSVQSLDAVSNDPSIISLKWVAPNNLNDQLIAFKIAIQEVVGEAISTSRQFQISDPLINEFKIDGLKTNTTYRLSIVAVTRSGDLDRYFFIVFFLL